MLPFLMGTLRINSSNRRFFPSRQTHTSTPMDPMDCEILVRVSLTEAFSGCLNGGIQVDSVPNNKAYTCDCSTTAFLGLSLSHSIITRAIIGTNCQYSRTDPCIINNITCVALNTCSLGSMMLWISFIILQLESALPVCALILDDLMTHPVMMESCLQLEMSVLPAHARTGVFL